MNAILIRSAAAALVMMAAAPGFAADKGRAPASQPQSADATAAKYCLSPSQLPPAFETGTIVRTQPKRECLTRKQWADKGISFDVK